MNTVTSERIKWIDKLRENISTFCGLTYTWSASHLQGKPEELEIIKQIDKLRYLIRLQLNPDGEKDKKIEQILNEIPQYTDPLYQQKLREIINSLIIESQKLLKEEWDKVKEESKRGDLKDNAHCIDTVLEHLNLWCLRVTKKAKTDDVELRPNANKRN